MVNNRCDWYGGQLTLSTHLITLIYPVGENKSIHKYISAAICIQPERTCKTPKRCPQAFAVLDLTKKLYIYTHIYRESILSSATTALSTLCQGRLYPHIYIYEYIYIYISRIPFYLASNCSNRLPRDGKKSCVTFSWHCSVTRLLSRIKNASF